MNDHQAHADQMPNPDAALAEVTEQITRRLQAGEVVNIDDYTRSNPTLAAPIRLLLPAIRGLAELGQSFARRRPGSERRIR